jgi:hypothetical protein
VLGTLLVLCALLQLAVLMRYGVADRSFVLDPRILTLPTLLQTILVPLVGVDWIGELSAPLREGARALSAFVYLVGLSLMLLAVLVARRARPTAIILIVAGLWVLVSVVNTFGALGPPLGLISGKGGARYFLFGAMCFCLLLAIGTAAGSRLQSVIAAVLLLTIAGRSIAQIGEHWTIEHAEGPSWKQEVAKCAALAPCEVAIWPNGWSVQLQSAR